MNHLKNHQIFESQDLHETQAFLSDMNSIDTIDAIGKNAITDVSIHSAALADIVLLGASFGAGRIHLKTPAIETDDLFLLFVNGGNGQVKHGAHEFEISPQRGLMRNMRVPLSAIEEEFSALGAHLPVSTLREHAHALTGRDIFHNELVFDAAIDVTLPGQRHVADTLHYIANALDGPLYNLENTIILGELRDLLLTSILMQLPNSYLDVLHDRPSTVALPRYVKRARDYIHEYAQTAIHLADLVAYAGCGYRTLLVGFNDVFGMAPMAYVKIVRLNRAHNDLLEAAPGTTVAKVAGKWGFGHAGRFAQSYAMHFGVSPSETLKRCR